MRDQIKTGSAILSFAAGVTFPLIGIVTSAASIFGWIDTNPWVGIVISVATFGLFFALGGALLVWVEDISWFTVSLPYLFSTIYTLVPDLIPFQLDDAAAMTVGALLSASLAIHKNPKTPKWILIPLLGAAIYTFFGGTIPGPIDEVLIDFLALLVAGFGFRAADRLS